MIYDWSPHLLLPFVNSPRVASHITHHTSHIYCVASRVTPLTFSFASSPRITPFSRAIGAAKCSARSVARASSRNSMM